MQPAKLERREIELGCIKSKITEALKEVIIGNNEDKFVPKYSTTDITNVDPK